MSHTTNTVTDIAVPNAAPTSALLRTDSANSLATTVPVSQPGSVANLDTLNVDLGAFFDNTPSAPAALVISSAGPSGSDAPTPTVSVPPTSDRPGPSLPPAAGPVKAFLDRVGLTDIPPKDKRFDGKAEVHQTQRDVHSLAQQTGRIDADLQKHRAKTTQVLECAQSYLFGVNFTADATIDLSAQIKSLQQPTKSPQATIAANARDISMANDRFEQLELIVTNTVAQVGSIDGALKTLIARFNAQAMPVPPHSCSCARPRPRPRPHRPRRRAHRDYVECDRHVHDADGDPSPAARREAQSLSRWLRERAQHSAPAPAVVAPAAATAAAVVTVPPVIAPAPIVGAPLPPAPANPPVPVTVAAPVAVVAVGGASPPPPLPAFDPTKEARLGPVTWGRNITGESSIVIKVVLPVARSIMRSYRARRGPDSNTIIVCFESAEIATWFIAAFNAARVAPYETVFASPNA
ncbi:hypothetical protein DFH07DRAFT_781028 [Mycena maculata]|uniref:Uncharacterized protein n=1 Tax=Mycena maculata TaxID=230809 RepID=A0AAD7I298_9AGAR|nr:hypothetical protein DFH07DRAFT_781028 [Mycena maculata]